MTAFFDWFDVVLENAMPAMLIALTLWIMGKINEIEGEMRDH